MPLLAGLKQLAFPRPVLVQLAVPALVGPLALILLELAVLLAAALVLALGLVRQLELPLLFALAQPLGLRLRLLALPDSTQQLQGFVLAVTLPLRQEPKPEFALLVETPRRLLRPEPLPILHLVVQPRLQVVKPLVKPVQLLGFAPVQRVAAKQLPLVLGSPGWQQARLRLPLGLVPPWLQLLRLVAS